jgi:hypothetical protein
MSQPYLTETIPVDDFINDANREYYTQVCQMFPLVEVLHVLNSTGINNKKIWTCTPQGDMAKFLFYENNRSIESFTHELLHLYLLKNGFKDSKKFISFIEADTYRESIFHRDLLGHINNVFAHEKMFPLYLKDFNRELFVCDYHDRIPIEEYKNEIDQSFDVAGFPNEGLKCFIATFFTVKDVRNPKFQEEYDVYLLYLENKNPSLYTVLNTIWDSWLAEEQVQNNKNVIENLMNEVVSWYKERQKRRVK